MELKKPELKPLTLYETKDLRKYSVIPLHAIKNKKISGENLRVLAIICASANRAGLAYGSQKYYGEQLGITAQAINKHIKKLKKAGLIQVKRNYYPGIKGNSIRVIFDNKLKDKDVERISQDPIEVDNKDIMKRLKANKIIRKVNKLDEQDKLNRVNESLKDNITFELVLSRVTREQDIPLVEKAINSGISIAEVYKKLNQGIEPAELVDNKAIQKK